MNKGYEKLAAVITSSLIIDYFKAYRDGDNVAISEAEEGLIYWEAALPMPAKDAIKCIQEFAEKAE